MGIRIRMRKVVFWGTMLLIAAVAGGLWFAYSYVTDSDTLASFIKGEMPRYLPGARLVLGRVQVRPLVGDVILNQVSVWQKLDGIDCLAVRIPWLDVRHDIDALWNGELQPREIVVAQPLLRLCRRKDGTWNLRDLLPDPWPGALSKNPPQILIQNGTVQLSDGDRPTAAILRDLSLRIDPTPDGLFRFEGSAKGDLFEHLQLKGTYDHSTGRITLLGGELTRLAITETLRQRLPVEMRSVLERVGLTSGEVDLSLNSLAYDPNAASVLSYAVAARLRAGMVSCPRLPFSLNDASATVSIENGVLIVERAEGYNGKTTVRSRRGGTIDLADPAQGRMNLTVDVLDLEFDERLRAWTPPEFAPLWDEYRPQGRISLALSAVRDRQAGPISIGMGVDCHDVALRYHHFPYPLDHVRGTLKWEANQIAIDMQTLIGLKPAGAKGTIVNPGPNAVVQLEFRADALPVDKMLLDALPPDVRRVVDQFQPTGSVRGIAHLKRTPPSGPADEPQGKVTIDAYLELNERCSITWSGLPYRVSDLTGQLELHPDHWVFKKMIGRNGLALIEGEGEVRKVGHDEFKTDLHLRGERLPFDEQLRTSLPRAWQTTWATVRPSGSSTVDARIRVEQGTEHYHVAIVPEPETRVELRLPRVPGPGVARGDTVEMPPMERVTGTFVFDDGTVAMTNVGFRFRTSPAHFARGTVVVQDSGQFQLDVHDLEVDDFRIDKDLRKIMPPVMAQFARRLEDGKTFRFRTNLGIGWSGQPGQPAWCTWNNALVVFNGNTIQTGLPLEHLQGQLENLWGSYNGQELEVHGALVLDSVSVHGQQVTKLSSPLDVQHNRALLKDMQAILLGGELRGNVEVDLEATPRFAADLSVRDADLQRYTKTLPGRQTLRGLVAGRLIVTGLGNDRRTLQGQGEIHISEGDLGELPAFLRLVKVLNLSPLTRTAFDSADAIFRIENGETRFDPIKFTGNAFSLRGSGTMSALGELNLALQVLYGRDEGLHIPLISDAMREASSQIFQIQVQGTPAYPKFRPVALLQATDAFRALGNRRANRAGRQ